MKQIEQLFSRALLIALLPLLSIAGAPLVNIDFRTVGDGVVQSAQGNYSLRLGKKTEIRPDGPTGTPYVHFDGSKESTVTIDPGAAASRFSGDEASVSFWFTLEDYRPCKIAYGFFSERAPNPIGESDYGRPRIFFGRPLRKTEAGQDGLWSGTEGPLPTNAWHHLAFTYSKTTQRLVVWFDGIVMQDTKVRQEKPQPVEEVLTAPIAETLPGGLADIRIWKEEVPADVILAMDVSPIHAEELAKTFDRAASEVAASAPLADAFHTWCKEKATRARALKAAKRADIREWMDLQRRSHQLPDLVRHLDSIARTKAPSLGALPAIPIEIYPYDIAKRLPFLLPYDGKATGRVSLSGAKGEFEAASFQLYPLRDIGKFHFTASDLVGPGGAKIPASDIDIRIVKCWHTDSGGWITYYAVGRGYGTLTPELLLHDDALIKTDYSKRANYVRCSYPDGDRYVWLNETAPAEFLKPFDIDREPVHDAAVFQPLPLRNGILQQFWILVRIPETAKAGPYKGTLRFTADGKAAGSMELALEVHPFRLPRPSPKYNIDRPFLGTWMHHCSLPGKLGGSNLTNAIRRLRAEFKGMADHNMLHPWTMTFGNQLYPDLTEIQIDLMKETGLALKPLFGDMMGTDMPWTLMVQYAHNWGGKIAVEDHPERFRNRCEAFSNDLARALAKLEGKVGHREVYLAGMDEAGPGTVTREMPFFMIARKLGAKSFVTSGDSRRAAHGVSANDAPAGFNRTLARSWHEGGAIVTTYAAPFSGPESPAVWRRNKGVRLYYANYDGCNEYVWYEGEHLWNDNAGAGKYRPFCIVYPTADGVLETVAWEAMREGYDDVRYLTLLYRLSRLAIRSGKRPLARLGKTAASWAELVNPDTVDLVKMRPEAKEWIVRLQEALRKEGVAIPGSVYR